MYEQQFIIENYNSLKGRKKVWVKKDKELLGIKIKQMVLRWM